MSAWLADRGFDVPRLVFASRTAVAACVAFVLAWAMGLEHPQWAAMTVWAASQPTRGQLLEKSFFRVSGTVIGTVAGVLLVMAMTVHPVLLVLGLALWVGGCTFLGNLQRGFVAYGTVLAGYTAAMVALLNTAHPDHVFHLGADRLATVLTGVLTAAAIGYLFAPPMAADPLRRRIGTVLADLLASLTRRDVAADPEAERALLSELAAIEEGLDPHAAGSLRSHREVRAARGLLIAAIPLLWRREELGAAGDPAVAAPLGETASCLRRGDFTAGLAGFEAAAARAGGSLREDLTRLAAAFGRWQVAEARAEAAPRVETPVVLHQDWVGAREAMWRTAGCLLVFGGIWLTTGWQAASFMLLGLSVMLTIFSTMENPARVMRFVLLGQVYGVLGALICRWLVWPHAANEAQLVLLTLPFILFGPFLVGHRRTVAASFDYNMVMLLLLQPHWPLTGSFSSSLAMGAAVMSAPVIAMAAYNYVYPPTLRRRLDELLAVMLRDLADLAGDESALARRATWQGRLYHRTLRLMRLSEKSERSHDEALGAGLAVLNLGHAAMHCHAMLREPGRSASDARALRGALARLRAIGTAPAQAGRALEALARRFGGEEARIFSGAAAGLATFHPQR